jgi:hypothetical protein
VISLCFVRRIAAISLATALVGCAEIPAPTCRSSGTSAAASAAEVCGHLRAINCPVADCEGAYDQWQRSMDSAAFALVTQCYRVARTCGEVDECSRACVPDAGR